MDIDLDLVVFKKFIDTDGKERRKNDTCKIVLMCEPSRKLDKISASSNVK